MQAFSIVRPVCTQLVTMRSHKFYVQWILVDEKPRVHALKFKVSCC